MSPDSMTHSTNYFTFFHLSLNLFPCQLSCYHPADCVYFFYSPEDGQNQAHTQESIVCNPRRGQLLLFYLHAHEDFAGVLFCRYCSSVSASDSYDIVLAVFLQLLTTHIYYILYVLSTDRFYTQRNLGMIYRPT